MLMPPLILNRKIWAMAAKNAKLGKSLDLKKDVIFKLFFGGTSAESSYCRCHLLSAVLGRKVLEAKVLNPQLTLWRMEAKSPVLDLHCRLEDGSEVDVELQQRYYKDEFVNRSVYYASKLLSDSLNRGKKYSSLSNAYQITFMNFITENDEKLHHAYQLYERDTKSLLTDMLQIHFIELPKLKSIFSKNHEQLSDLELWAMIILSGDDPNIKSWLSQYAGHKEELGMVSKLLAKLSLSRKNWAYQLSAEKWERDWTSRWHTGIDDAREEGFEQGISQGERKRALEDAQRLLALHVLTNEQIAQTVALSLEEVQALSLKMES